jgi:hypothetical protein
MPPLIVLETTKRWTMPWQIITKPHIMDQETSKTEKKRINLPKLPNTKRLATIVKKYTIQERIILLILKEFFLIW